MPSHEKFSEVRESLLHYRDTLREMKELLLANVVMAAEIPSPTGAEQELARFLSDRFTECRLSDIAEDEAGNLAAVLPGKDPHRHLLLAAHIDKIWPESEDHTVSVGVGTMSGRGIADNSLGVAVLATLPLLLERLGLELESNLILLGTSRSFGRGDLGGIRFFLDHTDRDIAAALCVEGMHLGRLSYSSLGMARGEIFVERVEAGEIAPPGALLEGSPSVADVLGPADSGGAGPKPGADRDGPSHVDLETTGVISALNRIVHRIVEMNRRQYPEERILVGTIEAGSGFNVPPSSGRLQFEIRGTDAERVAAIEREVCGFTESLAADFPGLAVAVEMIAHRLPGDLGSKHPLVRHARGCLEELGFKPRVEPSISELAALLQLGIPSLTLGVTRGGYRHTPKESISVDPIFDGIAQLIAMLEFMDRGEDLSSPVKD